MICVIAALHSEVEILLKRVKINLRAELPGRREVIEAEFDGKRFIVAVSGIGKVNSAVTMQYLLDNYKADVFINIGTAGGISGLLKKNDVLVAEAAYQHDYDLGPVGGDGYKRGGIPNIDGELFVFSQTIADRLLSVCRGLRYNVKRGILVSGDQFVADTEKIGELNSVFGAVACDMEAAAILQTAALNGVKKIAAVKSISDNANEDAAGDFLDISVSKERIADIVLAYL